MVWEAKQHRKISLFAFLQSINDISNQTNKLIFVAIKKISFIMCETKFCLQYSISCTSIFQLHAVWYTC